MLAPEQASALDLELELAGLELAGLALVGLNWWDFNWQECWLPNKLLNS